MVPFLAATLLGILPSVDDERLPKRRISATVGTLNLHTFQDMLTCQTSSQAPGEAASGSARLDEISSGRVHASFTQSDAWRCSRTRISQTTALEQFKYSDEAGQEGLAYRDASKRETTIPSPCKASRQDIATRHHDSVQMRQDFVPWKPTNSSVKDPAVSSSLLKPFFRKPNPANIPRSNQPSGILHPIFLKTSSQRDH
jgi:hypothetical protein